MTPDTISVYYAGLLVFHGYYVAPNVILQIAAFKNADAAFQLALSSHAI